MRATKSAGSPTICNLFSNNFMFTTSKAELRSTLAIMQCLSSSRALATSDCRRIPSVEVLLFFFKPCWFGPVISTLFDSSSFWILFSIIFSNIFEVEHKLEIGR